jgi:hypothetical protein
MSYLKNYHLLISHSWNYSTRYNTIVHWLNSTNCFKWSNHSVSGDNPLDTSAKTELRQKLTNQVRGCNAVIIISGMYATYSEWIGYEINKAIQMRKPIIGIRPWGNEQIPTCHY